MLSNSVWTEPKKEEPSRTSFILEGRERHDFPLLAPSSSSPPPLPYPLVLVSVAYRTCSQGVVVCMSEHQCIFFTRGRRPTGHGAIPVVVVVGVVVVGGGLLPKIEKRGVPLHSKIIVGDEPPCIFAPPCCIRRVTPHSEIIVGTEPPFIFWNHPVE